MTSERREETGPEIEAICARHANREGPLLPILHDVQKSHGHISEDAVRRIAAYLNLSRAEVHGVVSFYHDFRRSAPRAHQLKICRAEACQAVGGRALWAQAEILAAQPDCPVDIEAVYCLGNCPCAPAAQLDGRTLGRMSSDKLVALVAATGQAGVEP